ncbi:MAG: SpvB/TcaC N-terminal domain-containing protein [Enterobacterales bacterium]|nr:SpvB/TcaC N-terminal domain-containing protein [Enterobacterales bacterium]
MILANSQQPTANSQQPTANSQQPTANSQQPTANSQQPNKSLLILFFSGLFFLTAVFYTPFASSAFAGGGCNLKGSGIGEIGLNAGCGEPAPNLLTPPASITVPVNGDTLSYVISWTLPNLGTVSRYELEEHASSDPVGRYTQIFSGLALSKTIANQSPGVWSYRIRACDSNGCSLWLYSSNDATVTDPNTGGGAGGGQPPGTTPGMAPTHDPTQGAIAGQFRVSESGQVNYSVSFSAVPGRGGITPQLGLSYSSQGGNGVVGLGWNITGLSAIGRCRQTWEQDGLNKAVDLTASDRFCLDGQRLMVVAGDYGAVGAQYRTEIDSQVEVFAIGGSLGNPDHFEVYAKDGSLTTYGDSVDSKIYSNSAASNNLITNWVKSQFTDNPRLASPNGYSYTYETDATTSEFVLTRVDYSGAQANSVVFNYDSTRPDKSNGWSATGARFATSKRLAQVETLAGNSVIRRYRLTYDNSGIAQLSRLATLKECAVNNLGSEVCLKPTTFDWQQAHLGMRSAYSERTPFRGYTAGDIIQPIDINGDGRQDVAYNHVGYIMVGRSMGDYLTYSIGKVMDPNYQEYWKQLDYNGDGKTDLLYIHKQYSNYHWTVSLSDGTGFNGGDINTGILVNSGAQAKRMRIMDVNADGLPDLVYQPPQNTSQLYVKYLKIDASGNRHFTQGQVLNFNPLDGPNGDLPADATVGDIDIEKTQMMDINADGIADILAKVTFHYTGYNYYPEEDAWFYEPMVEQRWAFFTGQQNSPNDNYSYSYHPYIILSEGLNYSVDSQDFRIVDFNGDGLSDVLYQVTSGGDWFLLINKGVEGFGGIDSSVAINIGSVPYDAHMQFF